MNLTLHPDFKITELTFGNENAELLVIDNFISEADDLVNFATQQNFTRNSNFYPGIRAEVPLTYQRFILDNLQKTLIRYFKLPTNTLKFSICQYSMVTQPKDQLSLLQRIPHFDSLNSNGLASIHYLFKKQLGGTSFYRHKKTGFEYIDESRKIEYLLSLESENDGCNMPKLVDGYIYGDTPLYEHISEQDAVFNRLIFYRRNSLHSGSIAKDFIPELNPRLGRLSINSFIDLHN